MPLKKHTLLCLGDSYTIGEAVDESDRFPSQTVSLLEKSGIYFKPATIVAKTGWTTDELQIAIKEANLQEKYDIVTLLIGVNNQYRDRNIDNYKKEFSELLHTALQFADEKINHVFVLSIPDWGVTSFGHNDKRGEKKIGQEIDAYNKAALEISKNEGVRFINITPQSRQAKTDPHLIAKDGLHPSAKMYAHWAQELSNEIEILYTKSKPQ